MNSLTSIIVPTFNESDELEERIAHLTSDLDERYGERYELIVVDDASTDRTREVLRRMRGSHPRLVIEEHDRSAGFDAAVRSGIVMSRGDRLVIVRAGRANAHATLLQRVIRRFFRR